MSIAQNLQFIKKQLPENVTLVAVSKTKPVHQIMEAYKAGHKVFGENKIQEMAAKYEELPKDIEWHMIGHLQRNKVKYMAHFVHLIHGVDSLKTLVEIDKQAKRHGRIINCLLQIKIASEDSKFGMTAELAYELLKGNALIELKNIKIKGLMGMASFTSDEAVLKREFKSLSATFEILNSIDNPMYNGEILSMGMSGDYNLAIQEGSTMVRIGSAIFGMRNYN